MCKVALNDMLDVSIANCYVFVSSASTPLFSATPPMLLIPMDAVQRARCAPHEDDRLSCASSTPLMISSWGTTILFPSTSFSNIPSMVTWVSALTPGPRGSSCVGTFINDASGGDDACISAAEDGDATGDRGAPEIPDRSDSELRWGMVMGDEGEFAKSPDPNDFRLSRGIVTGEAGDRERLDAELELPDEGGDRPGAPCIDKAFVAWLNPGDAGEANCWESKLGRCPEGDVEIG